MAFTMSFSSRPNQEIAVGIGGGGVLTPARCRLSAQADAWGLGPPRAAMVPPPRVGAAPPHRPPEPGLSPPPPQ